MTPQSDAETIAEVWEEWPLDLVVVDTGGLGGGYLQDFQTRFGEACVAAEKQNKLGFRRLMNGAFRTGKLVLVGPDNEGLVSEIKALPWNEKGLDAATGFADHLSDALLYGYRACRGFAAAAPATRPAHGSPEWAAEEERRMEDAAAERSRWDEDRPWYEGTDDD
jgi:hypothetical protein